MNTEFQIVDFKTYKNVHFNGNMVIFRISHFLFNSQTTPFGTGRDYPSSIYVSVPQHIWKNLKTTYVCTMTNRIPVLLYLL